MSGTFPSSPGLENIDFVSFSPTLVSTSHSLKRQVRSRGGHRWFITGDLPDNMIREEYAPIYAFLINQDGQYETFTFTPPVFKDSRGTATGATINGADQTGRSVTIDALSGTLKEMDFVKFANHNKVYMLIEDCDNGGTTLNFKPALFVSPADDSAITVTDVPFTVANMTDRAALPVRAPAQAGIKLAFIEAP